MNAVTPTDYRGGSPFYDVFNKGINEMSDFFANAGIPVTVVERDDASLGCRQCKRPRRGYRYSTLRRSCGQALGRKPLD